MTKKATKANAAARRTRRSGRLPHFRSKISFNQRYTTIVSGSSQYKNPAVLNGGVWSCPRIDSLAGIFSKWRLHGVEARFLRGTSSGEMGVVAFMQSDANTQDATTLDELSMLDGFAQAYDNQTVPALLRLSAAQCRGSQLWYDCDQASQPEVPGLFFIATHTGGVATADTLMVHWTLDIEFAGQVEPGLGLAAQAPRMGKYVAVPRYITHDELSQRGEVLVESKR